MKTLKSVILYAIRNNLQLFVVPRASCPECKRGKWADPVVVRPEELFEQLHRRDEMLEHFPCTSSTSTVQRCGAALRLGAFQVSLEGRLDWGHLIIEWPELERLGEPTVSLNRFDAWTIGDIHPQTVVGTRAV